MEKKKFNDIYNEINQESQVFFQELREKQKQQEQQNQQRTKPTTR